MQFLSEISSEQPFLVYENQASNPENTGIKETRLRKNNHC